MTRNGLLHLILLAPLLGGVALMGIGLGDDYMASASIHDLPTTMIGLAISIVSGLLVAKISPVESISPPG